MIDYKIREMKECDWQDYRSIRLDSLKDSPDSFGSTYEREVSFSAEQWKARLRLSPTIHDAVAYAAIIDQACIGLCSCVISTPGAKIASLYQMWVSPPYRGSGVGSALLGRATRWAVSKDVKCIQLSVTTTNLSAISLYQSAGFMPFGSTEPLREGTELESQLMEKTLDDGDSSSFQAKS